MTEYIKYLFIAKYTLFRHLTIQSKTYTSSLQRLQCINNILEHLLNYWSSNHIPEAAAQREMGCTSLHSCTATEAAAPYCCYPSNEQPGCCVIITHHNAEMHIRASRAK